MAIELLVSRRPWYRGFLTGSYLIFLQTTLGQGFVALLLERDNNQRHKDVDEKEGEDNKVDHVEDGHLDAVAGTRTLVLEGGVHRVLQNPEDTNIPRLIHRLGCRERQF